MGRPTVSVFASYARLLVAAALVVACGGGDDGGGTAGSDGGGSGRLAGLDLLAGDAGGYGTSDGIGATARFTRPKGVVVDSNGNRYVADTGNHTIRKISPSGVVTTLAGLAGWQGFVDGQGSGARLRSPGLLAIDAAGTIYVSDDGAGILRKISPTGEVSRVAAETLFKGPTGIAVDGAGNIFVAETSNHAIRKIAPSGAVSLVAGALGVSGSADGVGSEARFDVPQGLALDSAGYLYVADTENQTIRKISPAGVVTTLAGSPRIMGGGDGPGPDARFNFPIGVAVDRNGNVYVADSRNNTIRKVSATGVVSTVAGAPETRGSADGLAWDARFSTPVGVAVDSAGDVYIADTSNDTVRKMTPAGRVNTLAGAPEYSGSVDGTGLAARFHLPSGLASDSAGNVYVADSANHTIRKITADGVVTTLAGSADLVYDLDGTGAEAGFSSPSGLAVAGAGNIYVVSRNRIRKVTPAGIVSTLAGGASGSADGNGAQASFAVCTYYSWGGGKYYTSTCYQTGLAADAAGNLYLADTGNNTIRKITPAGDVTTLAGAAGTYGSSDGTGADARFSRPRSIAVDRGGNVYVADTDNHTIRRISPTGVVSTAAGSAQSYGSRDGQGADARFFAPSGLAFDGAGNLYIGDSGNHTIRKLDAAGVVTTIAGTAGASGFTSGALPGVLRAPYPELWGLAISGSRLYVAVYNGVAVVSNLP